MNLENDYLEIIDAIFNGEKEIAIFVIDGKHHYVIDTKDNYCIDVRMEYKSYITKGWLNEALYDDAVNSFRNGIPLLTKESFSDYINKNNVIIRSVDWMKSFFLFNRRNDELAGFYDYIERFLSNLNEPVSEKWDSWRMRLPKFYINFDKKIFRHTDWDRNHESYVPSEWEGQANNNFGLLVPDKEQYWLIDGMNFWKLQM
ncbi:hypothetical protein BS412_06805 [Cronobacter turicensis]|uniref:Uncharacterized protein n=2 Tax=Cronobacter turicensis TaxID=413502 RepID=A0A2T7AUA1_9ENTR|nr:hypothetical protein [Cronobacter turicensis]PUX15212.1 hypothetical protein BS411_22465 [Cronobacter turicensis]PUX38345.1 hypothetical protein BS412_06805 [Cronobacter turicensis]TWR35008.1 hypothetical protein FQY85_09000 [Cronobacter turicensis]